VRGRVKETTATGYGLGSSLTALFKCPVVGDWPRRDFRSSESCPNSWNTVTPIIASQPPRKRSRISGESEDDMSNSSLEVTRSTTYWFDDGSITLQAELTQFRVHRTMHSRYSTVFRKIFEMPQHDVMGNELPECFGYLPGKKIPCEARVTGQPTVVFEFHGCRVRPVKQPFTRAHPTLPTRGIQKENRPLCIVSSPSDCW